MGFGMSSWYFWVSTLHFLQSCNFLFYLDVSSFVLQCSFQFQMSSLFLVQNCYARTPFRGLEIKKRCFRGGHVYSVSWGKLSSGKNVSLRGKYAVSPCTTVVSALKLEILALDDLINDVICIVISAFIHDFISQ